MTKAMLSVVSTPCSASSSREKRTFSSVLAARSSRRMRSAATPWSVSQSAMHRASEMSSPGPWQPETTMGMSGLSST